MVSAIRYSEAKAKEISTLADHEDLRGRIVSLFRDEHLTSEQIAERLADQMDLQSTVTLTTASSIVRGVLRELVHVNTRRRIHKILHAKSLARHQEETSAARDEWMRGQGMKVWSDDEDAFFLQLVGQPDMQRGQFANHDKISKAMCGRFGEGTFNAGDCRRHLELLRRTGRAPLSPAPRKRSAKTLRRQREDVPA